MIWSSFGTASVLVLLAACTPTTATAPAPPAVGDIVGVWSNGDTVLSVAADGTFALTDAPVYTRVGIDVQWRDGPDPVWKSTGTWSLEADALRIEDAKLFFSYVGSELVLEFAIDLGSDNPRCFQLVNENSELVGLGPEYCSIRA